MRIALVANPNSGGGLQPEELVQRLQALGAEVQTWTVQEAALAEGERLVAAGGDGTVGRCATRAAELGVPLAIVPVGTANDFARTIGLPSDTDAALRLAISGTRTRRLELGRIDGGPAFVNVAQVGLAPAAARHAKPLKPWLGALAYAGGGIRAALMAPPLPCRVSVDGRELFADLAWQVIVSASGAFGGGSEVAAADPFDGRLDVTVLPAGSRLGLVRRAYGLRRGHIAEQPGVLHERANVVELELPAGSELNVDGELVRMSRVRLEAVPAAFELLVG